MDQMIRNHKITKAFTDATPTHHSRSGPAAIVDIDTMRQ